MASPENDIVLSNLFTFESLVQFPLASIIQSSASGNVTTLGFLEQYCFHKVNGKLVAKTFVFYYQYVKGGAAQTMKVEIPVISLITIPYYTIKSAHFDMGVNVINWVGENAKNPRNDAPDDNPQKLYAMLGPYDATTTTAPTLPSESAQYSKVNTNMRVRMEVVSSDFPAGVLQLINVSSQGVEGSIANDLTISASPSTLIMNHDPVSLSLKLEHNVDDNPKPGQKDELALIPLTITVKSSVSGVDPEREFSREIMVTRGDLVGATSRERIQVLTDTKGEAEIILYPSGSVLTNGFVMITSPLTSNAKIYYRIDNA